MTGQIAEKLRHRGEDLMMLSCPLDEYLGMADLKLEFEAQLTALWRGYVGHWEIAYNRLYLVRVSGGLKTGEDVTLETIFPGYPNRVFAHWHSGTIRAAKGKRIDGEHAGFSRTYEQELLIEVERGVVINERIQDNRRHVERAPRG